MLLLLLLVELLILLFVLKLELFLLVSGTKLPFVVICVRPLHLVCPTLPKRRRDILRGGPEGLCVLVLQAPMVLGPGRRVLNFSTSSNASHSSSYILLLLTPLGSGRGMLLRGILLLILLLKASVGRASLDLYSSSYLLILLFLLGF